MEKFNIEKSVSINTGEAGLQRVQLTHSSGSSADVYLVGAHVTSFKNSKGEELIFLSSKGVSGGGRATRGGIPICWPQFASLGELPQHGFARTALWSIKESNNNNDKVTVVFTLSDSEETRKVWNNSFVLEYHVTLTKDSLHTDLKVLNNNQDDRALSFTGALHTYFRVNDVRKSGIVGLKGLDYLDKVANKKEKVEQDKVTFTAETDRVYYDAPADIRVVDDSNNSTIVMKKDGFKDAVVWNCWEEKAKGIPDLGDADWINYACAESAIVAEPIKLAKGESWVGKQEISKL